jgi:hypothetical protein
VYDLHLPIRWYVRLVGLYHVVQMPLTLDLYLIDGHRYRSFRMVPRPFVPALPREGHKKPDGEPSAEKKETTLHLGNIATLLCYSGLFWRGRRRCWSSRNNKLSSLPILAVYDYDDYTTTVCHRYWQYYNSAATSRPKSTTTGQRRRSDFWAGDTSKKDGPDS